MVSRATLPVRAREIIISRVLELLLGEEDCDHIK